MVQRAISIHSELFPLTKLSIANFSNFCSLLFPSDSAFDSLLFPVYIDAYIF